MLQKTFRRRIRAHLRFPLPSVSGYSAGICCIYHIFTRHCKAFIWVWVSGAYEGGRFVGTRGKPVVLPMCHRILCILRVPETGSKEKLWN